MLLIQTKHLEAFDRNYPIYIVIHVISAFATPPHLTWNFLYFYRLSRNACLPCDCDIRGTIESGATCDVETGQCPCKANTVGRKCDACKSEYYGLSRENPVGCSPCECNIEGTDFGSNECDASSGQCPCRLQNEGRQCSVCREGFFNPPTVPKGRCGTCNTQCALGCVDFGASTEACNECKNVESDGFCVSSCASFEYANELNVCQSCDEECAEGCTGPGRLSCRSYS